MKNDIITRTVAPTLVALICSAACQASVGEGATDSPASRSSKASAGASAGRDPSSELVTGDDDAGPGAGCAKSAKTCDPAASGFLAIDARLRAVRNDLRAIPNPADRERMRYIDLSNLANGGLTAEELQVYRDAVAVLMNSLSRGRIVTPPKAIDAAKLLYRVDLRDYVWDQNTWAQLEAIYPYAVIYDEDSRLFPYDESTAEQIREETNTQIPVIQADWFLSHASRPPLYHSLLNLPDSLRGLEQQLGIDIQRDIDGEQVLRSGFANAGPSQNNRVIERHDLGGSRGALWISYDFSDSVAEKNIFAHPLDFQEDGGEVIFNLENGLQGYFIVNAAGERLDKAPTAVVQDPASRDGAVENGLSCMNCHQTDGQLPKYDEIRDFQLNAGASAQVIEEVLAVYPTHEELEAAFKADQDRYKTARDELRVSKLSNTTMHTIDGTHQGILDLNDVAAVLGITSSELKRAIDASPQGFPPEIITLRTKGGGIQRDSFESIFADVLKGLGIGQQLVVGRRPANQANNNANKNANPANNDEDANKDANAEQAADAGVEQNSDEDNNKTDAGQQHSSQQQRGGNYGR